MLARAIANVRQGGQMPSPILDKEFIKVQFLQCNALITSGFVPSVRQGGQMPSPILDEKFINV